MISHLLMAVGLAAISVGADDLTFFAKVVKVEGNKVTYQKQGTGTDPKWLAPITNEATKNVQVLGRFKPNESKGKLGEPIIIDKGLADEIFKELDPHKGMVAQISIAERGDNRGRITRLLVVVPASKKK